MRIACVLIPSFAVAVERRAHSRLAEQPLVIYDRNTVLDASADATGVRRGLPLRQAKAACPQAVFVEANRTLYRDVAEAMLDALESVAPLVEPAGPGVAYADIRGLQGHYEDEFALAASLVTSVRQATGLLASVGIADGKFVAWAAASIAPPGDAGIVPPGREREFLQSKDISLLSFGFAQDKLFGSAQNKPLGLDVMQRLELLALRRLGDVTALPQAAVQAQFGRIGKRLWELAHGIDREPLRPRKRQQTLSAKFSFDAPVVASEALVMAARQLLARLLRRLRGRTARQLQLQLLADERILWERLETFREPTSDEHRIMLIIKTRLSLLELPQAADTVAITLAGIGKETAKQAKLFTDTQQNLNQIGEAIRQLRARYDRPMVYRIAEVDPCSRHPEERSALIPYDA